MPPKNVTEEFLGYEKSLSGSVLETGGCTDTGPYSETAWVSPKHSPRLKAPADAADDQTMGREGERGWGQTLPTSTSQCSSLQH